MVLRWNFEVVTKIEKENTKRKVLNGGKLNP